MDQVSRDSASFEDLLLTQLLAGPSRAFGHGPLKCFLLFTP